MQETFANHVKRWRHSWESCENTRTPFWVDWVETMVKNCCAVGCSNVYRKCSGIKFYRFPSDPEQKSKWIAAVRHENWTPNEHTWIRSLVCSQHFITGEKSNNPLALNYILSLSEYVDSPGKRRVEGGMDKFHGRQAMKRRQTMKERSVAVCSATVSEGDENEIHGINSNIQVVDDNEETKTMMKHKYSLLKMVITCCQLALSMRQNRMLKLNMRILNKQWVLQTNTVKVSCLKQQNSYFPLNICYVKQQSN